MLQIDKYLILYCFFKFHMSKTGGFQKSLYLVVTFMSTLFSDEAKMTIAEKYKPYARVN